MTSRVLVPVALVAALILSFVAMRPGETGAQAGATVQVGSSASLGPVLTGPNGMTLYVFANDTTGVSNCYDQCASIWPALTVAAGTTPSAAAGLNIGTLGTAERTDGSMQVTLDGRPLYYWASDQAPGDATGHGVAGVWFALDGNGTAYPIAAATATATTEPTAAATTQPTVASTATTAASTPAAPTTGTGTAGSGPSVPLFALAALAVATALFGLATGFALRRNG
jgi:predicted lipoprotein with Yx(FWY)xxD motif